MFLNVWGAQACNTDCLQQKKEEEQKTDTPEARGKSNRGLRYIPSFRLECIFQ